jgi:putative ABC transport system permease protein
VASPAGPGVPGLSRRRLCWPLHGMEASRRFEAELLSMFSVLELVLAIIGIYSLLHYAVTQRSREVGIRVAPGAQRVHLVRLILR